MAECPACSGDVHVHVTGHREYQGEFPMGSMVWFVDDSTIEEDCGCGQRSERQTGDMVDKAIDAWDPYMEMEDAQDEAAV